MVFPTTILGVGSRFDYPSAFRVPPSPPSPAKKDGARDVRRAGVHGEPGGPRRAFVVTAVRLSGRGAEQLERQPDSAPPLPAASTRAPSPT